MGPIEQKAVLNQHTVTLGSTILNDVHYRLYTRAIFDVQVTVHRDKFY